MTGTPTATGAVPQGVRQRHPRRAPPGRRPHRAANPWFALSYATTGLNVLGVQINVGQSVTRREALRMYTRGRLVPEQGGRDRLDRDGQARRPRRPRQGLHHRDRRGVPPHAAGAHGRRRPHRPRRRRRALRREEERWRKSKAPRSPRRDSPERSFSRQALPRARPCPSEAAAPPSPRRSRRARPIRRLAATRRSSSTTARSGRWTPKTASSRASSPERALRRGRQGRPRGTAARST